jgi:hypothetical protein
MLWLNGLAEKVDHNAITWLTSVLKTEAVCSSKTLETSTKLHNITSLKIIVNSGRIHSELMGYLLTGYEPRFITMFIKANHSTLARFKLIQTAQSLSMSSGLILYATMIIYFFKIPFNIMIEFVPRPPKWSLPLRCEVMLHVHAGPNKPVHLRIHYKHKTMVNKCKNLWIYPLIFSCRHPL